jgi:hypothetical protein
MRWLRGVRLSKVDATLLVFGLALLVVAVAGPRANVNGISIGPGASWWQRAVFLAVGVLAIGWAVLASRGPVRALRAGQGFLGAPPRVPARLVQRPDLSAAIVRALRAVSPQT